ncbi:MAG: SGNH/GDSL hydrolase family protein [Proteobacteria bacterium]|nr:SGNH/GDSL hydrolase family protein [Pseudomonadota bacterium]
MNLGSSFAAGAGTGPVAPGSPPRCFQSSVNYARLLAAHMNLALADASCAGATSTNLLNAWRELPAQIDAITSDTALVTITVGGNDLAFAGNLTAASCEQGETIHVAGMTLPCPSPFPVSADAYDALERNLIEVARQSAARAPHARIIFIQYVTLVPQRQCPQSRLTEAEATELRGVARRLADITNRAATRSGAAILPMDRLSERHTPCDPDPWSVGLPGDYNEVMGAPWHPNRRGMQVIAERLEQMLSR